MTDKDRPDASLRVTTPELWICAPSRALVTAPGVPEIDAARLEKAEDALRSLGWIVREAANVRSLEKSFAGTDIERARGFEEAMCAPSADLVLGVRGGSGAARILELVDWEKIAGSQAVFMGLSDMTALNLALLAKCGKASWQGPVAASFAVKNAVKEERFMRALSGPSFSETMPVAGPDITVEGTLWGGNLSVLTSLIGTPYFPDIQGGILYLEDIHEPAWRISRMVSHLELAGVLKKQKLILACDFTGADKNAGQGDCRCSLADMLAQTGLPVVSGIPFGHIADTMSLPFGVKARVAVENGTMTLTAPECPAPTEFPGAEAADGPLWWI